MTEPERSGAPDQDAARAFSPHRFGVRVYYEDTDLAGVVYHANYLRFLERGRSEMLRDAGVDQAALKRDEGVVFMVARCDIAFRRPARYDDQLTIETELRALGAASLSLAQRACFGPGGSAAVEAAVEVAAVRFADGRPVRLPTALRDRLAALAPAETRRAGPRRGTGGAITHRRD